MKKLLTYVAGKVSPDSVFGRHDWRDEFCAELTRMTGFEIINLDPIKGRGDFGLNENDSKLVFGRDCYMIRSADLVIVNLTDDISVGGSIEMLVTKHYHKPLIGIARQEGKFRKAKKEIRGRVFENYTDPFVATVCDSLVGNIQEAATWIKHYVANPVPIKDLSILSQALEYYKKEFYDADEIVQDCEKRV
ncbi:MAG: hypothetical protein Q8Q20_01570 [bacterium]|nr:hypothetical protein [bacterium]